MKRQEYLKKSLYFTLPSHTFHPNNTKLWNHHLPYFPSKQDKAKYFIFPPMHPKYNNVWLPMYFSGLRTAYSMGPHFREWDFWICYFFIKINNGTQVNVFFFKGTHNVLYIVIDVKSQIKTWGFLFVWKVQTLARWVCKHACTKLIC